MKTLLEVFSEVTSRLESNNIPYMVVGSMAAMVYGEPRLTHDIDLVLNILPEDCQKFSKLFPIEDYYCPPPEVLKSEIVHRGQFNLIHQKTQIKIDIMIRKNTEHSKEEFSRRETTTFWEGYSACLARPEDVIIKKLSFFREGGSEKHIIDIRGILANSEVNMTYLKEWIDKLQLHQQYDEI